MSLICLRDLDLIRHYMLLNIYMTLLLQIKNRLDVRLDCSNGAGDLPLADYDLLYHLFAALVSEPPPNQPEFTKMVRKRLQSVEGLWKEYQAGLELLRQAGADENCHAALERLLPKFPHPDRQSGWRRKLRLTSFHLFSLFEREKLKRLRKFLIRDLLTLHYDSPSGWESVGYSSYPGAPDDNFWERESTTER